MIILIIHINMDSMSRCYIRLVFTLPPRDNTLQYKRCVHLWNNFPCIITLVYSINNEHPYIFTGTGELSNLPFIKSNSQRYPLNLIECGVIHIFLTKIYTRRLECTLVHTVQSSNDFTFILEKFQIIDVQCGF